ncbi:competence type IV pilus minor pilin ComGG [Fredinandcohnia onubensis]|uniref:competence type IV pilus minor pilin ComGG n=1 Tax=Fredinandcohnia onubensis TaxID=1571209 RepID=UPI000C0C0212|nr:competence type IV pilus minor pilin ComGG [Fredinandcohnia onubensis]
MKNEQGFILPVTLAISFLFFLVFTFQVNAYLTEKGFSKETEEIFILENLMQLGVEEIRAKLKEDVESSGRTGSLNFPTGTISYTVVPITTTTSQITISCTTKEQRKYSARFVYDYEKKVIGSWIELR